MDTGLDIPILLYRCPISRCPIVKVLSHKGLPDWTRYFGNVQSYFHSMFSHISTFKILRNFADWTQCPKRCNPRR